MLVPDKPELSRRRLIFKPRRYAGKLAMDLSIGCGM